MNRARLWRLYGVIVKEFRQMRRDMISLSVLLLVPALLLALYGYALTFDVKHIRVVVLDHDKGTFSRQFTEGLFQSEYFDFAGTIDREAEATRWLDTGDALAVLVFPPDFGKALRDGRTATAQVLIDGSNANTASIALAYFTAKAREFSAAQLQEFTLARGITQPAMPVVIEPRVWYNAELKSSQLLVPGLIGYLLMLAGTVATSLSVVREKERGTMEQLAVSPLGSGEFILGKTIPYLAVSLLTSGLVIAAAMVLFEMPLRGSIPWLFVTTFVFLLGALGLGLWVSTLVDTQQLALQISLIITLLPALLLSGMVFPIASMPRALQWVSAIVPPRHFLVIMRSILLKGTGPKAWLAELGYLTAFAVFIPGIAVVRTRRRSEA